MLNTFPVVAIVITCSFLVL